MIPKRAQIDALGVAYRPVHRPSITFNAVRELYLPRSRDVIKLAPLPALQDNVGTPNLDTDVHTSNLVCTSMYICGTAEPFIITSTAAVLLALLYPSCSTGKHR